MTVKAVYASKTLAIYITGRDVAKLLQGNIVLGPVIAADETIADEGIDVRMTVPGIQALSMIRDAEIYNMRINRERWRQHAERLGKKRFKE